MYFDDLKSKNMFIIYNRNKKESLFLKFIFIKINGLSNINIIILIYRITNVTNRL